MAKKSLGQHWLNDRASLDAIVEAAELSADDTVLEIGPGLGSLTRKLLKQAAKVIAVEIDPELAARLKKEIVADNLVVIEQDILEFDLRQLPNDYKVVANIPYYLSGKLIRLLTESVNPPERLVLLVQKEVAERIAATSGDMNLLALSAQINYDVQLGPIVPAELFAPTPKVDSQIVILARKHQALKFDEKALFRLAKAGFSEKRKKLRSSLAGGLDIDKTRADQLLAQAEIKADARAQELSLEDWQRLISAYQKHQ